MSSIKCICATYLILVAVMPILYLVISGLRPPGCALALAGEGRDALPAMWGREKRLLSDPAPFCEAKSY